MTDLCIDLRRRKGLMTEQSANPGEIEAGLEGALCERMAQSVRTAGDAAAAEQRSQATGRVGSAGVVQEHETCARDAGRFSEQSSSRGCEIQCPGPAGSVGCFVILQCRDAAAEIDLIPAEQPGLDRSAPHSEHESQDAFGAAEELGEYHLEFVIAGITITFGSSRERRLGWQTFEPRPSMCVFEGDHGRVDAVTDGRCGLTTSAVLGCTALEVADQTGERLIVDGVEPALAIDVGPHTEHGGSPRAGELGGVGFDEPGDCGGCGGDAAAASEQIGGQAMGLDRIGAEVVDDAGDLDLPVGSPTRFFDAPDGRVARHHALRSKGNAPVARAIVIVPDRNHRCQVLLRQRVRNSGRLDLNQRPLDPQSQGDIWATPVTTIG